MKYIQPVKIPKINKIGLGNISGLRNNNLEKESDNNDFLPIIRINRSETSRNCIISMTDCFSKAINLGNDFDKDLKNYVVPDIVIAKNSKAYIAIQNIQGYDGGGYQDGDGMLEFKTNTSKVKIRLLKEKNPEKCDTNSKLYDLKDAAFGHQYTLEISHTLKRGDAFSIEVYASDDNDGFWGRSKKVIRCGKFNFTVVHQDVFMEGELKKGLDLLSIISQEYRKKPTKGEYSVNYCIQAADRFLGAIVDNKQNFYAYDDKKRIRLNVPDLSNAISRAKKIKSLGYGYDYKEFETSLFGYREANEIDDYGNNPSRILFSKNREAIVNYFKLMTKNKIGFHVFYLSIVDALHTLFIVVDNNNPCSPTYKIYDEAGESSSKGLLKNIDEGILSQSQWVYTWTKKNVEIWAALNVSLLKFQRK